jgi:hypothetical protein
MYQNPEDFNRATGRRRPPRAGDTVYQVHWNPQAAPSTDPSDTLLAVRRYRVDRVTVGRLHLTRLDPDGSERGGHVRTRGSEEFYATREEAIAANLGAMRRAVRELDRRVRQAEKDLCVFAAVLADRGASPDEDREDVEAAKAALAEPGKRIPLEEFARRQGLRKTKNA